MRVVRRGVRGRAPPLLIRQRRFMWRCRANGRSSTYSPPYSIQSPKKEHCNQLLFFQTFALLLLFSAHFVFKLFWSKKWRKKTKKCCVYDQKYIIIIIISSRTHLMFLHHQRYTHTGLIATSIHTRAHIWLHTLTRNNNKEREREKKKK